MVVLRRDLRRVLGMDSVSGAHLAEFIWKAISPGLLSGSLKNVRVVQSRDLAFDYAG